jgi:hypothetical protein
MIRSRLIAQVAVVSVVQKCKNTTRFLSGRQQQPEAAAVSTFPLEFQGILTVLFFLFSTRPKQNNTMEQQHLHTSHGINIFHCIPLAHPDQS